MISIRQRFSPFTIRLHHKPSQNLLYPQKIPLLPAPHPMWQVRQFYGSAPDSSSSADHLSELHTKHPDLYDKQGVPYSERPSPWGIPVSSCHPIYWNEWQAYFFNIFLTYLFFETRFNQIFIFIEGKKTSYRYKNSSFFEVLCWWILIVSFTTALQAWYLVSCVVLQ